MKKEEHAVTNGEIAADELCKHARTDKKICVVTAAMPDGTGMNSFSSEFPERFYDVGIAEEHAVTMAAGLASEGMHPYVALFSTFLQRCYDQIAIDVCRCSLPVTFLLDRAGFVGADGKTHQGIYDLSYLRTIPNMTIAAGRDDVMLRKLIDFSTEYSAPLSIRYSKQKVNLLTEYPHPDIKLGKWQILEEDDGNVVLIAAGSSVQLALNVRLLLAETGITASVVDAIFIKPIDSTLINRLYASHKTIAVIEENSVTGGLGEAVLSYCAESGLHFRHSLRFGAPDGFIEHATISQQREMCGLTPDTIARKIKDAYLGHKENE